MLAKDSLMLNDKTVFRKMQTNVVYLNVKKVRGVCARSSPITYNYK